MAETRYITVPYNITVTDTATGQERRNMVTFADFMRTRCNDASFGKDLDGVFMSMAIRQHCSGATGGEVIGLELQQWEALCEATRHPSQGYNPEVMAQLIPYVRAILDAPSRDPRPQAAEECKS